MKLRVVGSETSEKSLTYCPSFVCPRYVKKSGWDEVEDSYMDGDFGSM
jgi:hypothetical protein